MAQKCLKLLMFLVLNLLASMKLFSGSGYSWGLFVFGSARSDSDSLWELILGEK
jgi:hypothetical protein